MIASLPDLTPADLLTHNGGVPFLLTGDPADVRRYAVEIFTRYRILVAVFDELCQELDTADATAQALRLAIKESSHMPKPSQTWPGLALAVAAVVLSILAALLLWQTGWMLYDIVINPKWAGGRWMRWASVWSIPVVALIAACVCGLSAAVLARLSAEARR